MAASMLMSWRYLPRSFSRLFACRAQFGRTKASVPVKGGCQLSTLGAGTRNARILHSLQCGVPSTASQLAVQRQGFHRSSVFHDEFQIVNTPPFAESITEGDVRWEKGVGDYVAEDELVAEIETDKTSMAIPSPASGIIEELFVADGDRVEAGQQLFKLRLSADAPAGAPAPEAAAPTPAPAAVEPAAAAPPTPPAPPAASAGPIPTAPPPVPPVPTAPLSARPTAEIKPTPAAPAGSPPAGPTSGARTESRVKMSRMRLRIAQRLKDAQNTCAMLTTFNEIDMSNLMEMRSQYQEAFVKKHGLKVGFMSAFLKASAYALQDQPSVNAVIDDNEIVYRDYVDISVAVATPKGLVVPVVRNVEAMDYAGIEHELNELGGKARTGNLAIEDMDGGTFTVSNGGVFGSLMGTPIINPPQSAILGMHGIFDRPVAVKGQVVVRPMMYVALTYDHRLIDGREAVIFLRKVKSVIEDPRVLLLNL